MKNWEEIVNESITEIRRKWENEQDFDRLISNLDDIVEVFPDAQEEYLDNKASYEDYKSHTNFGNSYAIHDPKIRKLLGKMRYTKALEEIVGQIKIIEEELDKYYSNKKIDSSPTIGALNELMHSLKDLDEDRINYQLNNE